MLWVVWKDEESKHLLVSRLVLLGTNKNKNYKEPDLEASSG